MNERLCIHDIPESRPCKNCDEMDRDRDVSSRWALFATDELINLIVVLSEGSADKIGAMYDAIGHELKIRADSGYDDEAADFYWNSSYSL